MRPCETEGPAGLRRAWSIARRAFREFGKDRGTLMAASVSFYVLLSLVPLVLVGLAIFGYLLGDAEAETRVMEFLRGFFPAQFEMLRELVLRVKEDRGAIGGVGLVALAFTGLGGFATLETAINVTWGAPNRSFLWNKLFALGMMLLIGGLLVLSLGITSAVQWASSIPPLRWLEERFVLRAVGWLLGFAVSGAMFTFIYKFFPNAPTRWKPALIAGFLTAFLWELFKLGYTLYTGSKFGNQEATYGAMAGFVGLITWVYYSTSLVLLGSELTWVLNGCPEYEKPGRAEEGTDC